MRNLANLNGHNKLGRGRGTPPGAATAVKLARRTVFRHVNVFSKVQS
jgi:hypothetical protein